VLFIFELTSVLFLRIYVTGIMWNQNKNCRTELWFLKIFIKLLKAR